MSHLIDLSAFADPILDELGSREPEIDGTHFLDVLSQVEGPILQYERGIRDITGLELSSPSLAYARDRAKGLPIRWIQADVRDFHLDQRFAFVFARGDVFDFLYQMPEQEP